MSISFIIKYLYIVYFFQMAKGGCRGKTQSRFDAKKSKPPLLFTVLAMSAFLFSVTFVTYSVILTLIDVSHFGVLPIVPIISLPFPASV